MGTLNLNPMPKAALQHIYSRNACQKLESSQLGMDFMHSGMFPYHTSIFQLLFHYPNITPIRPSFAQTTSRPIRSTQARRGQMLCTPQTSTVPTHLYWVIHKRGLAKISGTFWGGGPCNKDYSILGSKLGSPYFGKLPYPHISPEP